MKDIMDDPMQGCGLDYKHNKHEIIWKNIKIQIEKTTIKITPRIYQK